MNNSRGRKVVSLLLLFAIGSGLVSLGTWLHGRNEWAGLIFEHLGVGVFAVTLLKVTIEEVAQEQFLGELKAGVKKQIDEILASLVTQSKWILNNPSLIEELQHSVLAPDFIRPYYNLALELEPLEDCEGLLRVRVSVEFKVRNISPTEKKYVVEAWLDDVVKLGGDKAKHRPKFTSIQTGLTSHNIDDLVARGKAIQPQEGGAIYAKDHMIYLKNLPTEKIEPDDTITIKTDGVHIMRIEDHFAWNLKTITEKLLVSIKLSGGLTFDQLDICPREMHHIVSDDFIAPIDRATPNIMNMEIGHVLLPFQGVEIRWAPKPGSQLAGACRANEESVTTEAPKPS